MNIYYFAHSLKNCPPEDWQPLEDHLTSVAKMAAEFARSFGGDQWCFVAGKLHDLGKYFQLYLLKLLIENHFACPIRHCPSRVIHSAAGGHLTILNGWPEGVTRVLSWLIMGHHTGLADFWGDETGAKSLRSRMENPESSMEAINNAPESIIKQNMPTQPPPPGANPAFFIRMLFSCLVDADFLDTENFMDKKSAGLRGYSFPAIKTLLSSFNIYIDDLCEKAKPTEVNQIRAEVLGQCRNMANQKPSVFSLTVPTGGGKTLSSLAFALEHAAKFKKDRIIYVIPYTSIIEQTADVFRQIPGFENAVIEHHSNVVSDKKDEEEPRVRLAAENWDAPVIITTAVQFFESLYACRPSQCRKLHNIVNSVVIFDEAQCFPAEYLRPAVFAIRELFRHYHVTPILCTATQPTLTKTKSFDFRFREGFEEVKEVIPDPDSLALRLKRVKPELYKNRLKPVTLNEIAESIKNEGQSVLCIVNRKKDARNLARLLPQDQVVHLSTNMCAEHRTKVLMQIRKHLKDASREKPLFVISTSLVEAGVDIDFPVVYRAIAGLDSIAQAGGRCNREGLLQVGKLVIFVLEGLPAYARQPTEITKEIIQAVAPENLLFPAQYEKFFQQLYWQLGHDALDKNNILGLLSEGQFRTAAARFNLIEDTEQVSVIVPYGNAKTLLDELPVADSIQQRQILRRLGRFTVNIPQSLFAALSGHGIHETDCDGVFMLDAQLYDDFYGFVPSNQWKRRVQNETKRIFPAQSKR